MQDRIKKHDQDIRLRTEISAVSEVAHNTGHKPLWNEVKFIDRDPYYYTRRVKEAIHVRASCFIRSRMTSRPHHLKKTSSMQSKRRDLHHTWLHRETNEELKFCYYSPLWITTTFLICVIHNRTIGGLTPPDRYRIFNTTVSFQSFHSFEAALHFTAKLRIEINVNVIVEFEVFIRHCFTGHSFFYN